MTDVVKRWITDFTAVVFSGTRTLASLDDDEWTDLSDELNNISLGRAIFCDFHLHLDTAVFVGADSAIELYLLPAGNADVYPDWAGDGTADLQAQNVHSIGSFTTSGDSAAQELYLRDVEIPPGKFKLGVRSKANVQLAATNTLFFRFWSHASS